MIIESKAPTRVDFAGSTLDIWPLYLFHPGAVTLNAAISLYASCIIETHPSSDNRIKLVSRDIKCEESFASFAALDRFTGAGKGKVDWIHISRDAEAIVINV